MTTPVRTSWDDLLDGVTSAAQWHEKRADVKRRFLALLRDEAAPEPPRDFRLRVEREWDAEGFSVKYVSYQVEADERAHAYLAAPAGPVPAGGFPGVVCLHGTTNWGARRSLGIPPEPTDPHASKSMAGMDDARNLVRNGYVTISPEHFCCASRLPAEGSFDTAPFYRRHPGWSAAGKATYENKIALSVLAAQPSVDPGRIGVTGFSLGGHGTLWLAAYDERVACAAAGGPGGAFRENPNALDWARDRWYIYFPQLRELMLSGRPLPCDFHDIMALIAPRPCLESFAINDRDFAANEHRVTMHMKIAELYRLLGRDAAHAFLVYGDGHSLTDLLRAATVSWMDRWLKYGGDPIGEWRARHPAKPG